MSDLIPFDATLPQLEEVIRRGLQSFVEVGAALLTIRDRRLYREQGFRTFEDYCRERWNWSKTHVNRQIEAAGVFHNLTPMGVKPPNERQARELVQLEPEAQRLVSARLDFSQATAADVEAAVEEYRQADPPPARKKNLIATLEQWNAMSVEGRDAFLAMGRELGKDSRFNSQSNESIDWAKWSWNPVTGCLHNCPYCYARDIAFRWYDQKFTPALWADRLPAPYYMRVPRAAEDDISYRNVFVCSMADLFGQWVPARWIELVLDTAWSNPQWNFLFLTKFPLRMAEFEYPPNAWLGTSVDLQARVKNAEKAMSKVKAAVKWLSLEPLIEPLQFENLGAFQWIVIGGASASTQTPAWRPPRRWVWELTCRAMDAGCLVYHKTNLDFRRLMEFPGQRQQEATAAPAEFQYLKVI